MPLFSRGKPYDQDAAAAAERAAKAAAAGSPVEIETKKPVPVDDWTRAAQLLLGLGAVALFVVFGRAASGDIGYGNSGAKSSVIVNPGGATGQSSITTTITRKPRQGGRPIVTVANTPIASSVKKTVVVPAKIDLSSDSSRVSDTMTTLIGLLALALALVAATLPRLRSFEFQGIKIDLSGDSTVKEQGGKAAKEVGKQLAAAAPASGAAEEVMDLLLADADFRTALPEDPMIVLDTDAVGEWAATAVTATMTRARERQVAAVLLGRRPHLRGAPLGRRDPCDRC